MTDLIDGPAHSEKPGTTLYEYIAELRSMQADALTAAADAEKHAKWAESQATVARRIADAATAALVSASEVLPEVVAAS